MTAIAAPLAVLPALDDLSAETLRVVTIGHVDHGKSTMVGRLLYDCDALPEGKVEELRATSEKRGMPFEWAFLTDALKSERDQGITIDVSEVLLKRPDRNFLFIDTPGHREFIRNMLTGAARADAALLLVDVTEGVQQQTRLHGYLVHLLGLRHVVIAINKMDLVDFNSGKFEQVRSDCMRYLSGLGLQPAAIVPVCGRDGDNLVKKSTRMPWYQGPTIVEALSAMAPAPKPVQQPLRIPVQGVYKFDMRRIVAGEVRSGKVSVGDILRFSPSGKTGRVKSIEAWPISALSQEAVAGESVGFTMDEQIFIERGEVASHDNLPPTISNTFCVRLFWLDTQPLRLNDRVDVSIATRSIPGLVHEIRSVTVSDNMKPKEAGADGLTLERYDVGDVVLRTRGLVAVDPFSVTAACGRLVLQRGGTIVGCGLVTEAHALNDHTAVQSQNLGRAVHTLTADARVQRNGHRGGVIWLTGLSGAGKSTIAMGLERALFANGYQVYVLDGDNVRHGLNRDLGFSPDARTENIRRVGEVAALFADAGLIVVAAFISPFQSDRDLARKAAGDAFREVYVNASLAMCEARDPKGLYRKARAGDIREFTGISAPYEAPIMPDFTIDTGRLSPEDTVEAVLAYVRNQFPMQ